MATLASLTVDIGANSAKLVSELQRANKSIDTFGKGAQRVSSLLKTLATGAAIIGFARIVKSSIESADALGKLSDRIGVSVEALSELEYAGKLADVPIEIIQKSFQKLSVNILDARSGLKSARDNFDLIGLSVSALSKLQPDKQFELIADKISKLDSASEKTAITMKIFGKSGVELLPLFKDGAEGIRAAREEAERFGITLSDADARAAEFADDQLTRLNSQMGALTRVVAINVVPVISSLAQKLIDSSKDADTLKNAAVGIANGFQAVVITGLAFGDILQGIAKGTAGVAASVSIFEENTNAFKGAFKVFSQSGSGAAGLVTFVTLLNSKKAGSPNSIDILKQSANDAGVQFAQAGNRLKELGSLGKIKLPEIPKGRPKEEKKGGALSIVDPDDEVRAKANKKTREALAKAKQKEIEDISKARKKEFDDLVLSLRSEAEVFDQAHKSRLDIINNNLKGQINNPLRQQLIDKENQAYIDDHANLVRSLQDKEGAIKEAAERRRAIENESLGVNAQFITDLQNIQENGNLAKEQSDKSYRDAAKKGGLELLSTAAQQNKKAFELNKLVAISNATVSGYEAVQNALATKAPWPLPLVFAGIAAANAALQVNGIRKTTFGGGGSVSGASASGVSSVGSNNSDSGSQTNNQNNGAQNIEINLRGISDNALLTKNQLRSIINQINEELPNTRFRISA